MVNANHVEIASGSHPLRTQRELSNDANICCHKFFLRLKVGFVALELVSEALRVATRF